MLAFQDVLKNAECHVKFWWLIRVFFTAMLKLISILFLFSKIFLDFSVTRGMRSLKNNTCIQENRGVSDRFPTPFGAPFWLQHPLRGFQGTWFTLGPGRKERCPRPGLAGTWISRSLAGSAPQSPGFAGREGQGRAGRGAAASGRSVAPASSEYGLFSCPLSSTLSGNWDPGGKGVDIRVPEAVRGG